MAPLWHSATGESIAIEQVAQQHRSSAAIFELNVDIGSYFVSIRSDRFWICRSDPKPNLNFSIRIRLETKSRNKFIKKVRQNVHQNQIDATTRFLKLVGNLSSSWRTFNRALKTDENSGASQQGGKRVIAPAFQSSPPLIYIGKEADECELNP